MNVIFSLKNRLCGARVLHLLKREKSNGLPVEIPDRIQRGPTDILQALSETVKVDPAALDYNYPPSGLFLPITEKNKRVLSLSKESGRKAAKWVVDQNPEIFNHRNSAPYIKAFAPQTSFDPSNDINEDTLIDAIDDVQVINSMKIYENLKEKQIDVSNSTKQMLLELVCFYNCINPPDETLLEDKYFSNVQTHKFNTWKKGDFADKLFMEMEPSALTFSAVIQGMLKYGDVNNGFIMYEKANNNGYKLSVGAYNAILSNICSYKKENEIRKTEILKILSTMNEKKVMPNLGTLNGTLTALSGMRTWAQTRNFSLQILAEFVNLNIQPSLGTYYRILDIFFDKVKVNDIFLEILDEIEGKSFEFQHPDDLLFFLKAMEIACVNFRGVYLADRVLNLLHHGNNSRFLNNGQQLNMFYRHYFNVLFDGHDIRFAIQKYKEIVPTYYIPELHVMTHILLEVAQKHKDYLPTVWSDVKEFDLIHYQKLTVPFLNVLVKIYEEKFEELGKELAWTVWDSIENPPKNARLIIRWDSDLLSDILILGIHINDENIILKAFKKSEELINGLELTKNACFMFIKFCISTRRKDEALICLNNFKTYGYKGIDALITEIETNFELNQTEKEILSQLKEEK